MIHLVQVVLRLADGVRFPFLHGRIVYGLLAKALGLTRDDHFPAHILPLAVESGRTEYDDGSPYGLGLVFLDRPQDLWPLVRTLDQVGEDTRRAGRQHLGGNFRVERVIDAVASRVLEPDQPLRPILPDEVARAAERLAGKTEAVLRFHTPLRLPRHHRSQVRGHAFCDDDRFEPERLLGNLTSRLFRLAPEYAPVPPVDPDAPIPQIPVGAEIDHLFWVDLPKANAPQTTGGVMGQVCFRFPQGAGPAAAALVLGQYLGAGKDITFGFGHYRLLEETGLPELPRRVESLAQAAARMPVPSAPPVVEDDDEEDDSDLPWLAQTDPADDVSDDLLASLADGSRRPPPLTGRIMVSESGKARALAVPSEDDQRLQRQVQSLLAPAVDELLETSSFAFRRGLSRVGAAAALSRAQARGLGWVLRADIAAFFDSVSWPLLQIKLEALFDGDPLAAVIQRWVQAPVRFGTQLIERDRGLPQGAVLSPLLSNLFLDQFDDEAAAAGFKLVRYADDFVICGRDRAEVEAARSWVLQALAGLDLTLQDGKTKITRFDEGFTFLGYVFCRSLVMETEKKRRAKKEWLNEPADAEPDFWRQAVAQAPAGAWLAGLDLDAEGPRESAPVRMGWDVASRRARALERVPVYLSGADLKVRTSEGRLLIRESEEYEEVEIPLNLVEAVIAVGPVYLSTPVIRACLRHEAPVHLWTASGDRLGTLDLPGDGPSATIIGAQVDFIRNPEKCLAAAREIVAAKIYNHRQGLRRQAGRNRVDDNALAAMKELMGEALRQPSLEALRGVEGRAARVYFDRIRAHLPAEFGFSARSQRPAADPVNALLNFGYSLLYRQIVSLLAVERLHPGLGFYHKPSDRYHALAADLQEEFRYWADLLVLRLIHRGQLTAADFAWTEKGGPACRIQPSALRAVILLWQTRLEETLQLTAGGPLVTFRQRIHEQIRHFKSVVLNPDQGQYRAFRSR